MKVKPLLLLLIIGIASIKAFAQIYDEQSISGIPNLRHAKSQWVDLNNNGRLDLLLTGQESSGENFIGTFRNNGDGTFTRTGAGLVPVHEASLAVSDYNQDGLLDILITGTTTGDLGNTERKTYLYKNTGNFSFEAVNSGFINAGNGSVAFKDLDNDGLQDVLINGRAADGTIIFRAYKNTGSGFEEKLTGIPGTSDGNVIAFDFNNNGLNDILISGVAQNNQRITRLYRNNGDFTFTNINFSFEGTSNGDIAVADLNNDGYQDIIMSGRNTSSQVILKVYMNNGGDNTFDDIVHGMPGVASSALAVGDMNNDGWADILLAGAGADNSYITRLFLNNGNNTYSSQAHGFPGIMNGSVSLGDYNNDQKADVAIFGLALGGLEGRIYRNINTSIPAIVQTPDALETQTSGNAVTLSWDYSDGSVPAKAYTYELYLSTVSGGRDMISPTSDINTGKSRAALFGAFNSVDEITFNNLPQGVYYWGVQAVDAAMNRSAFSAEQSITVCEDISLGDDQEVCEGETVQLTLGEGSDVVNWSSVKKGILATGSFTLDYTVTEDDIITVELTNALGCIKTTSLNIAMLPLPDFDIGGNRAVCYDENLFIEIEGNWAQIKWFSDKAGEIGIGTQLDYPITENDRFWAEVTDERGCSSVRAIEVSVLDLPVFDLGGNRSVCYQEPLEIDLGDTWASVKWFNETGLIGEAPELSYPIMREEKIWAEVEGANGCISADTILVSVLQLPGFSIGTDAAVCYGQPIQLTAGNGWENVTWFSLEKGFLLSGENLEYTVTENDVLWATVENEHGCISSDSIQIEVLPLPDFSVGNDTSVCYGQSIEVFAGQGWEKVNWHSARKGLLVEDSWFFQHTVLEKDTLWAEVYNGLGCVNYDSIIIDMYTLPEFDLGADTAICYKEHITLSTDIVWEEVQWYSANRGMIANGFTLDWEVLEDDILWAEVKNQNGCLGYDTIAIHMFPLPDFDIGSDTAICYQENIELNVGTGWKSVSWSSKEDGLLYTGETFNYKVLKSDTLIAEVLNFNNCVRYDTIVVTMLPLPEFNIGEDMKLCHNSDIVLRVDPVWELVNWYTEKHGLIAADAWFIEYTATESDKVWAEVHNQNGCINYDSIYIEVLPLPEFSLGNDTVICFKEYLSLEVDASYTDVKWYSQTNGLISDNEHFLNFQVTASDHVWAEVKDAAGCINRDTIFIQVENLPVADLGDDMKVCFDEGFSLEITGAYTNIFWYSLQKGLLDEGSYRIDLKAEEDDTIWVEVHNGLGCIGYDTILIEVNPLPQPQFAFGNEISSCFGEDILLSLTEDFEEVKWFSMLDGYLGEGRQIGLSAITNDKIYVEVRNAQGCLATDTFSLVINPLPEADAGPDRQICDGEEVQIGNDITEGHTYEWSPPEGLSSANIANPLAAPFQTTEYYLKVTNENGCVSYDTVTVKVNPPSIIDAGYNASICIGESIQLGGLPTATGSDFEYTYEWSPKESLDDPFSPNPIADPIETTLYTLKVKTSDCAEETAQLTITVNPLPEVAITEESTIGNGESIVLEASGGTFYEWTPFEGLSRFDSERTVAAPTRTTVYTVRVITENGCESEKSVRVNVRNEIFVPNLFTPNGDGENDFFKVYGYGVDKISFRIYTKHGNTVYETQNVEDIFEKGWDGTYRGAPLETGTYIWMMDAEYVDGAKVLFNGKNTGLLQLMR